MDDPFAASYFVIVTTLRLHLQSLMPKFSEGETATSWPPDTFALAASILKESGAYFHVLRKWPPEHAGRGKQKWVEWVRDVAKKWRDSSATGSSPPKEIADLWSVLLSKLDVPLGDVAEQEALCCSLLELVSLSDAASAGVGISDASKDDFLAKAQTHLLNQGQGASLCSESVSPVLVRVLPKQHTPGNGLTLRSLTHHLALHNGSEVIPRWWSVPRSRSDAPSSMNLLLAPWPMTLRPKQFRPASGTLAEMPDEFRFMTMEFGEDQANVAKWTEDLLFEAEAQVGRVDGVIFPESALSESDLPLVKKVAASHNAFLIAGVMVDGERPRNTVVFNSNVGGGEVEVRQDKHHRWKLDRSQIEMYGLGGTLDPTVDWWERTDVGRRDVNFLALDERLTLCCLVCEDLARQDPVADLVRSVGPNLVVALLMDAAQLAVRWPARYATVLADDPGSSVLTLTSAGMVGLARTPPGKSPSRSIALWKDARSGMTEIELPKDAQGILLSLYLERSKEWSADGRNDGPRGASFFPRLGGIHPIFQRRTDKAGPTLPQPPPSVSVKT